MVPLFQTYMVACDFFLSYCEKNQKKITFGYKNILFDNPPSLDS